MVRNFAVNFVFDEPVNAVRDFRRLKRAQKRHNDIVHATKKRESRRQAIEHCPEDSVYFHYPYRNEALRRLDQPGRWTKYVGGNAAGYIKYYPGWDIEKANAAEKALRRAEKLDEEIADKADALLNQYEDKYWRQWKEDNEVFYPETYNALCTWFFVRKKAWAIIDNKCPSKLFVTDNKQLANWFGARVENHGGDVEVVAVKRLFCEDVADCDIFDLDKPPVNVPDITIMTVQDID